MREVSRGLLAMPLAAALLAPVDASADDASFGCKVLLCAVASAPGWSGIPYCVPVMRSLLHDLAHGGSWPNCPEGNTSGLGYDPYLPCPGGTVPMQTSAGTAPTLVPSSSGALCADPSAPQTICQGTDRGGGGCRTTYPTVPRPARTDPYYVDITSAAGTQRFNFSLQDE